MVSNASFWRALLLIIKCAVIVGRGFFVLLIFR